MVHNRIEVAQGFFFQCTMTFVCNTSKGIGLRVAIYVNFLVGAKSQHESPVQFITLESYITFEKAIR